MEDLTFLITRPSDVVQKAQMEGRYFYERLHPVFSDIGETKNALIVGAGTGDLSVFLRRERGVARLTLIEPDVSQHENLLENCTRNIDSELDLRYLGYAAGAESGRARMEHPYSTYRGGARLIADGDGPVYVAALDDLLAQQNFDLVIVDVNGAEAEVLFGMQKILQRSAPKLAVLMHEQKLGRVRAFLERRGYTLQERKEKDSLRACLFAPPNSPRLKAADALEGAVNEFDFEGASFMFFSDNPHDAIQAEHVAGRLYEPEEIDLIRRYAPPDAAVLDVGANIGNHCAAFEKLVGARRIVAIEPNPRAIRLLKVNTCLNQLRHVDLGYVGVGLGRETALGAMTLRDVDNLGGARLELSDKGAINIARGDDLLRGERFDFIKIDVEGAELAVLDGLAELIDRDSPMIFIEVEDAQLDAFAGWMNRTGYEIIDKYKRYKQLTNWLVRRSPGNSESVSE